MEVFLLCRFEDSLCVENTDKTVQEMRRQKHDTGVNAGRVSVLCVGWVFVGRERPVSASNRTRGTIVLSRRSICSVRIKKTVTFVLPCVRKIHQEKLVQYCTFFICAVKHL